MTAAATAAVTRLATLLVAAIVACAMAADAGARSDISVTRPAPGEVVTIEVHPGLRIHLEFDVAEAMPDVRGGDFILRFRDEATIVFEGLAGLDAADQSTIAFVIDGTEIPARQALATTGERESAGMEEPASGGAGKPDSETVPPLTPVRHTGRDVLFTGESERQGYPLYSYLLCRGTGEGVARERRLRFERAIDAFVGLLSTADDLKTSGAAIEDTNIFYAPIEPLFQDTTVPSMRIHLHSRPRGTQRELIERHYDFARAEVMLDRLGLDGGGPYIVSSPKPLAGARDPRIVDSLVQNLSHVPPELVALWIEEFKRQVVHETAGTPESLRRFALEMRTSIARFAEAFEITRSAVAEMFEPPN